MVDDLDAVLEDVGAHTTGGYLWWYGAAITNPVLPLRPRIDACTLHLFTDHLRSNIWVAHLVSHARRPYLGWHRYHLRKRRDQQPSGVAPKSTRMSAPPQAGSEAKPRQRAGPLASQVVYRNGRRVEGRALPRQGLFAVYAETQTSGQ